MKRANRIVLVVSIIFIVSGLAFIASGFQEKTVTAPLLVKADKTSSESNKSDATNKVSEKKAQKKSEAGSSTVHSKLSSIADADSAGNSSARSNSESESTTAKAAAHSTEKTQTSEKSSGASTNQSSASNTADSSNQELVSVEIKGYDNKDLSGHVPFKDGMTAFRALKAITDSKKIALDYSGFGTAVYVKGINGQSAGDKSAQSGWIYTVNGKTPNVSAGIYALHSGDTLVWTYQE